MEFGGTVYKSVPDVAPSWEYAALRGCFLGDDGVAGAKWRRRAGF